MLCLQDARSTGALPPAFGSPRDICFQYESGQVFHSGENFPAGGSALGCDRNGAEPGAQNSSFKNLDGQRIRA